MTKKVFYTLVGFLITSMGLVVASCGNKKPVDEKWTDTYSSGAVNIASDESFSPIIDEELAVFHNRYYKAKITPIYTDEVNALNLLMKDSVRLAITTRKLKDQEMEFFRQKQFRPKEILLAKDGLALIVNKSQRDTLISTNQLRDILSGKKKYWDEVYEGASSEPIIVVFDNPNSSTVQFVMDSVCYGKELKADNLMALEKTKDVVEYVSNHPNTIGVVGVNWVGDHRDTLNLTFTKDVRIMSVSRQAEAKPADSFKPFQYYLYTDDYPLSRPIYMILSDPRRGLSWGFCNFLQTYIAQKVILKSGLLPAIIQQGQEVEVKPY
ncbi:MAG: substrate-binding domain-containing protein [Prevotellaceae bacterium]|nr:substrate-binding domain-containing protein [Prevotellaceae bacterium]